VLLNLWAARIRIFSKDFFDKSGREGLQRQAIGTGPFRFVSWQRKDRLVLEANADWYIAPPRIKGLVFRIIPETGARVAELQAGGVHIISNVPPFIVDQLNKPKETDVQVLPSLRVMYMILDTLSAPELKDKRVRQALNYAVDKEAIISGILRGMATPVGTHIPIRVPGVDQSIKPYPYNPEKAKSLLKEAGYPDGFALNLYSPTGRYSMDKEVTLSVADQLLKVGIKPNVNIMETSVYFSSLMNRTLKGIYFIGTTCGELDVNFSLALLSQGFVLNRYKDEALEDMVKKVGQIMKSDNRFEMARLIQKTIHDDAVFLYLYNEMLAYGFSTKVQGFEGRSDEMMDLWNVSIE
jgi:peptide/nickel transport system substrate-binding protein